VAIALLLVQPMLSLFHSMLPSNLQFHWFTPDLWLFLFGLIVITTLLAGLYPARVISSWLPVLCLKGSGSLPGEQKTTLRKGLIIFQFTISLAFIIGTLIVQNQISYMRNQDLGFSTDAVMTIETDVRDQNSLRSVVLAQKISELPGVHKVARQSFDPITSFYVNMPLQYRGKKIIQIDGALQIGDTNFIPLYDIKLLAGTNLSGRDSLKEAVINESMSKAMGFASPTDAVGQTIWLGESPIPIKGVVADFHEHSYREAIRPILIGHVSQPENMLAVKLDLQDRHPADLKRILAQIEKAYKEVYAGQPFPFTYHFLDDAIEMMYKKEEQTAFLLRTAVIITVFISCIGLFGLAMYTARQRTKEIGIRKVLGATGANIITMLSRNFLTLVAIAALIASPFAWLVTHYWLQDFVYRAPVPAWAFLGAALGALGIAFLTILSQTMRAALTNPVDALRDE
jgi:putative ABC transport system permease protein